LTFPQIFVTRFFQLVTNRQFTESERELQRIKDRMEDTKWNTGYYHALDGMLIAQRSNSNNSTFFAEAVKSDKSTLKKQRDEFLRHVQSRFHGDFDRGFFQAWSDFTRILIKTAPEPVANLEEPAQTTIVNYTTQT
jgi:hypothetical protein